MMCQRMGWWPTGTMGLGRNSVSSRKRVPRPPQRTNTGTLERSLDMFRYWYIRGILRAAVDRSGGRPGDRPEHYRLCRPVWHRRIFDGAGLQAAGENAVADCIEHHVSGVGVGFALQPTPEAPDRKAGKKR